VEPDFGNLSKVWATLNPTGVKASAYTPSASPVACPDYTSGFWEVNPTSPLPTLGQQHDFKGTPTSGSFSATATGTGTGSQGSSTSGASGTQGGASGSATPSTTGASDSLSRNLKAIGAVFAGAVAVLAWL
jgi:hypothetical protein